MKRNLMICLAMGLLAAPVLAQEAKKAEKPEKAEKAGAKKGEGDMAAMMAAWKKYATPGEGHAVMKPIAGSWTAAVKMWMPGGAPPQESTATSEGKWIMGDRYIQEDVKGTFNGMLIPI